MLQSHAIKLVDGSATVLARARRSSSASLQPESTLSGVLDNVLALLSVALILATAGFVLHACIGS